MTLRDELRCTHSWQNSEGEPACCPDCLEAEVKRLLNNEVELQEENRRVHKLLGRSQQRGDYWTGRAGELQAEVDRLNRVLDNHVVVGDAIMAAVRGRPGPLSDSDVIGEVERMRAENELLKSQRDMLLEYAVWWWQQRDAAAAEYQQLREWNAALQHDLADAQADVANEVTECQRLQSIVDRLPKTADGVPVIPGVDAVFWPKADPDAYVGKFGAVAACGGCISCWTYDLDVNPHSTTERQVRIDECYSTREAAEKARQSDET